MLKPPLAHLISVLWHVFHSLAYYRSVMIFPNLWGHLYWANSYRSVVLLANVSLHVWFILFLLNLSGNWIIIVYIVNVFGSKTNPFDSLCHYLNYVCYGQPAVYATRGSAVNWLHLRVLNFCWSGINILLPFTGFPYMPRIVLPKHALYFQFFIFCAFYRFGW